MPPLMSVQLCHHAGVNEHQTRRADTVLPKKRSGGKEVRSQGGGWCRGGDSGSSRRVGSIAYKRAKQARLIVHLLESAEDARGKKLQQK